MRRCYRCERTLVDEDFYVNPRAKCKECQRADVQINRICRRAYYVAYEHSRAMAPHRVAARLKRRASWDGRIDKMAARLAAHVRHSEEVETC